MRLWELFLENSLGINLILVLVIIYMNRRRPARSTMLWVMMMALFPILGFIPYLFLGQDTRRRKMFQRKESLDLRMLEQALVQLDAIAQNVPVEDEGRFQDYLELVRLNMRTGLTDFSGGNQVTVFTDGIKKFHRLIQDIDAAQEEVNLQYYILKSDELGMEVIEALIRAAQRGVKVRVLSDGVGARNLSQKVRRRMREEGVDLAIFFPSILGFINLRLNYRNHRKIVAIDNRIGYIGGFNVGDDYVGRYKRFGYWRDTHVRIEGPAEADLKLRFLQDWDYAKQEKRNPEQPISVPYKYSGGGNVFCQLVSSGPDTPVANIKFAMLKMISAANDVIYIQTPYFIPDTSIMEALMIALQQGVEVNLMIPDKPDHPVVFPATMSFAGDLIRAGANVYCYNGGFLHSKVLLIDDYVSLVGSCNMDERSFSLNFEASELLYSKQVSEQLRQAFRADVEKSTLMTVARLEERPLSIKLKEPLCRLFAPLL